MLRTRFDAPFVPSSFPYPSADYEQVACNLCGGRESEVLARRDRNGLRVQTCICANCGLIYFNPRMTAPWYSKYYSREYREQMARFRGVPPAEINCEHLFPLARKHGSELAKSFGSMLARGLTVEVGSSVGGVLSGIQRELGGDVLGIEPSRDESDYANSHGIKTFCASIETFREAIPLAANIICTQSLNHFLNPRFFLEWAHRNVQPEGRILIEVMNFRQVFRRFGWMPRAIQIDHTYMFVPEVLQNFVSLAGFEILSVSNREQSDGESPREAKPVERGLPKYHCVVVAKKGSEAPFPGHAKAAAQYTAVRESLASIRNSSVLYFLNYGWKRQWKRIMNRRSSFQAAAEG